MMRPAPILILILALSACREEEVPPGPVALTPEAVGHYCQMNLLEHPGPKAQVHLRGMPPLFFSQVRDALAYQRMPEQEGVIAAVYVNDMAVAPSWQQPGPTNWIAAAEALYVVGSDAIGGMEVAEAVPFSTREGAQRFAADHGGRIVEFAALTETDLIPAETGQEDDYAATLRRLSAEETQ